MGYDPAVPSKLKKTQKWFASIITRPIDEDSRMNPISPSGVSMEEEAWDYIKPSPALRPAQRIQIYNQQYWWRLLNTLHENFPLLTRLFGYHDFNQSIGIPYLDHCPPNSWSLNPLGDRLPEWIQQHYEGTDKPLVFDAARLDWAYNFTFVIKGLKPLCLEELPVPGDMASLLPIKLYLQPAVHFFHFDYDLFSFRREFLKHDPEYWIDHDFPPLPQEDKYFILYRTKNNDIAWTEVSAGEYQLLEFFKKGSSIEDLCQWLEKQEGPLFEEASGQLHAWLQNWVARQWLSMEKPE